MSKAAPWIVSCGASHVAAGRIVVEPGGDVRVASFFREDLDYDLSGDAGWLPALTAACRRGAAGGLRGEAVIIAPGSVVLTKLIRVPLVEDSRSAQTIAYEAQQNVPFPLAEAVWDYQILGDDGVEQEVLIVAGRASEIEGLCRAMESCGLEPVGIGAAPVLDHPAFRGAASLQAEQALIVNIGARTTNLTFSRPDGFFVRTVALGGNALTQGMADNLGKDFGVAEAFKLRMAAADHGEDETAHTLFRNQSQQFGRRLANELVRSVAAYRRHHPDAMPTAMVLTGRGSELPGIGDILASRLKLPVAVLDLSSALVLEPAVDPEQLEAGLPHLSALVGQAVAAAQGDAATVDLLPSSIRQRLAFKRSRPYWIVAAAGLCLAGLFPWLGYSGAARTNAAELARLEGELAPLRQLQAGVADRVMEARTIAHRLERIEGLARSRGNWIAFLVDLQDRLVEVEEVWLDELEVLRDTASGSGSGLSAVAPVDDFGFAADEPQYDADGYLMEDSAAPAGEPEPLLALRLSGRMVDRENPLARVSANVQQRVNRLLASFLDSAFIAAVEDKRFDTGTPGILRFEFVLVINPEKPL